MFSTIFIPRSLYFDCGTVFGNQVYVWDRKKIVLVSSNVVYICN